MNPILCRKALVDKARAFFILAVIVFSSCQVVHKHTKANSQAENKTIQTLKPITHEFTVSFVGDVILHERLRKREDKTNEGYNTIWSNLQNYIDLTDISYANLEGPVAEQYGGVSGFPMFNYPEKIIPNLQQNGFDIVSTANNHALDRQSKGVRKTIENLKKYNLAYTGTVTSSQLAASGSELWWGITPLKNTNLKLAWLACTEMTNGNPDKDELVLYCYKDKEIIKALIQQIRQIPDIAGLIITPHWGEEQKYDIELGRRIWARQMIELGASAVVGSHPHVVQTVEEYTTKAGHKSVIAYSLGNFISNQPWVPTKASMMLFTKWRLNLKNHLELTDVKYIPLWMNRSTDKDYTSKFKLQTVFDFSKVPDEATRIWKSQIDDKFLFKSENEVINFLKK